MPQVPRGLDYAARKHRAAESAQPQSDGEWIKCRESFHRQDYADQGMLQAQLRTTRPEGMVGASRTQGAELSGDVSNHRDPRWCVARIHVSMPGLIEQS